MSEKWFVCSESELENLKGAAFSEAVDQLEGNDLNNNLELAKAACRARPAVYYSEAHDFDGKLLGSLWSTSSVKEKK